MLPQGYRPGQEINLPSEKGSEAGFVPDSSLPRDTQEDMFMLREADSITIDPHKAAYVAYPAGRLCYRCRADETPGHLDESLHLAR